jgi:site-specific DNA recombinase
MSNRRSSTTVPAPVVSADLGELNATAVLYARVSTKEQAERDGDPEGYSIPAQREACTRKAQSLGAVVVDEFVDRGESARTADRPELQRMLEFVRDNSVTYVIVHKIDRLARNRADDVAINLVIRQAGVQLVSVTENIDETPSGILLHGIMSSIAEFYSRNLASEVIKGSVQKAKSGGTPMRAPTGYLNVRGMINGQEVRSVEIDPVRGPLMKWAFDAYSSGKWTIRSLCAELTERGLTSAPGPKTPAKPLGTSNLQRLLRHPYYMGIVRYRGVLYQGKHDPLVSPETWQQVQELLAARNIAGEKQREHHHYLKGSVYCGTCGSRLVVSHAKNRHGTIYPYFICVGRQQKRTTCTQQAIRIEQTEEAVVDEYTNIRLTPEQSDQVREFVLEEIENHRDHTKGERERLEWRMRTLRSEQQKLLDAHYADAIPLDLLKTEQSRITTEVITAKTRLTDIDCNFAIAEANLARALVLARDCETAYQEASDKVRRQFNQVFFKRLLIDDEYHVIGELAEPFETLLGDEVRLAATMKAEAELQDLVDSVFDGANKNGLARTKIALAGVDSSLSNPAPRSVQGLKEKTMVGAGGLEPSTSAV